MKILIVNDDGIHATGILALAEQAPEPTEVFLVAPQYEQSGVSQAITFLSPLFPVPWSRKTESGLELNGFAVNGTPVDCVKLAISELCPWKPDFVLSGINGGLNAGINVCHSGTVGAALAASTFGLTSFALSIEYTRDPEMFNRGAKLAWPMIEQFAELDFPNKTVVNINMPMSALDEFARWRKARCGVCSR